MILLITVTFSITACSSFSYDKEAAIKRAKEYIDMLNAHDYQGVYNALPKAVANMHTADDYRANYDNMLDAAGSFVEYTSTKTSITSFVAPDYFIGQNPSAKDYESAPKTKYIKVDITAKYEKSTFIYTITLSKDLDLAELGFYSKPND